MPKQVGVAYIPVLHKGYFDFVEQLCAAGVSELYLVGDSVLEKHEELDYINRKDRLRALSIDVVMRSLAAALPITVTELTDECIQVLQREQVSIVTPSEDIGTVLIGAYFADHQVTHKQVFLRRNKENIGEDKIPDTATLPLNQFQSSVWDAVFTEATKSTDWWRQVGAALVQGGEVIYVTHNEHMPEEQLPNIEGDTRSLFKKGLHINYVTSAHAEVAAIGAAAREGLKTDGAELFVTDFPCPYCARLIVKAGIKKVYYVRGYAVLDGDDFFKEAGIEVMQVQPAT